MTRITEIWQSLRAMPLWVQIWMIFILVPVNCGGLLFLDTPQGRIAAILGITAMLPNILIIWFQRGFSKAMAIPHLPIWTPLTIWIIWLLLTAPPPGALGTFLLILLIVDLISLTFDYADAWKWWYGNRAVIRPTNTEDAA